MRAAGTDASLLPVRFREIPLDLVLDRGFRTFFVVQVRAEAGFPPDIQPRPALLVHIYCRARFAFLAHKDDLVAAAQPFQALLKRALADLAAPPILREGLGTVGTGCARRKPRRNRRGTHID